MTSTPGFEPSPHWWEESALTQSFSFWFLFVLSSVSFFFFSSLFLEIGRNASWSCNHLSTYILIVGFHGSNHMLIVRTELSSVSCVALERVSIGEEKCDVTLPWQQNFWITTMGDLSNDNGDGNEHGIKAIGLYWQNNNFARASRFLYNS